MSGYDFDGKYKYDRNIYAFLSYIQWVGLVSLFSSCPCVDLEGIE